MCPPFTPERMAKYLAVECGGPLPGRSEQETKSHYLLSRLSPYEKNLIAYCTNSNTCGLSELKAFIDMHPGVRELRMRNFISAEWSGSEWRTNVSAFGEAKLRLYSILQLNEPTNEEKLDAVTRPHELSDLQRRFICSACSVGKEPISPSHVLQFKGRISSLPQEEAVEYWRNSCLDLLTIGNLVHKIRFGDPSILSASEKKLLDLLSQKIENFDCYNHLLPNMAGYPLGIVVAKLLALNGGFPMSYKSLTVLARAESEFLTLVEFLGFDPCRAEGKIDNCYFITESAAYRESADQNEDSSTGALVKLHDGAKIRLDAVWDGVGGYGSGDVASRIAKEIFEVAAVAGWIRTPEDVRRILVITDVAIMFEQLSTESWFGAKASDIKFPLPSSSFFYQRNKMGTTAVVTFQRGDELFVIHAGDSEFGLYGGGGQSNYLHINHSRFYFQALGEALAKMHKSSQESTGAADQFRLRAVIQRAEEDVRSKWEDTVIENVIMSALGIGSFHIQINGLTWGYKPIKVEKDAVLFLCSDGISDVLCQHEIATMIKEANGDLALARQKIMELAISKSDKSNTFEAPCGCSRNGKDDDKTLILRFGMEGF